jgi:hypothetical protein
MAKPTQLVWLIATLLALRAAGVASQATVEEYEFERQDGVGIAGAEDDHGMLSGQKSATG